MSEFDDVATAPVSEEDIEGLFLEQRSAFALERNPTFATRRGRLDRLNALVTENEDEIVAAIAADFGTRPSQETAPCREPIQAAHSQMSHRPHRPTCGW